MKFCSLIISLLLPGFLLAQYFYPLSQPIATNAYLLKSGDKTILINPIDSKNEAQLWTTFDSTLKVIAKKKLITPEAKNIISQTYVEGNNCIYRIDQFLFENHLRISAFAFDITGRLLFSQQIESNAITGNKMQPLPFYIAQSENKKYISLVQSAIVGGDSIGISKLVLNEKLNISGNTLNTFLFDPQLSDMHLPIVTDEGNVVIITADKFTSYKLGSTVKIHVLPSTSKTSQSVQFEFDRKKIKGLTFKASNDILVFRAFFSEKMKKNEIAGVLYSGLDLKRMKKQEVKENLFAKDVKQQLKKTFSSEGHKGSILNYISFLPQRSIKNEENTFAVLLPMQQQLMSPTRKTPASPAGFEDIRQQMAVVNALVGTTPRGFSTPLDLVQATTYAAVNNNPSNVPSNAYQGWSPKSFSVPVKKLPQSKNLLSFSFKDSSNRFLKIKQIADPNYQFFSYLPGDNNYSALYYVQPNFKKTYLNKTTIDEKGGVTEKNVFQIKNKTLLHDYPHIFNGSNLVAFYENKITGEMGITKIRL
jgi:hypothetical protein